MHFFCYFFIQIQYAKTFLTLVKLCIRHLLLFLLQSVWLLESYWCLMVVNKFSYRMCAKIKKYVKILLLEFLNEDHILHCFTSMQIFF